MLTAANLWHAVVVLFFAYAFFLNLRPLADPDLWWHLKTGQMIVEEKSLPGHEDPFSFTTPRPLSDEQVRGLRSQWLGQAVFYLVFLMSSYSGLAVFRTLLIILPFVYLYVKFSRRGVSPPLLLAFLAFPPVIIGLSLWYAFERPQGLSFVLSAVLIFFVEGIRKSLKENGTLSWRAWGVFVLMALWANLHGGYIVGVVILLAYMAGEGLSAIARRLGFVLTNEPVPSPRKFFIAGGASVLASLANPGGLEILKGWVMNLPKHLLMGSAKGGAGVILTEVLEYKPLWYFYKELHYKWPLYISAFYAVCLAAIAVKFVSERKVDVPRAILAGFFAFIGLYYAKGANFAMIGLSIFACWSLVGLSGLKKYAATAASLVLTLVLVTNVALSTPGQLRPSVPKYWVSDAYPEFAIRFIEEKKLGGPMFNFMQWGGYLIWRTSPAHKVFFDGRAINTEMAELYLGVVNAAPMWKSVLGTFNVNFILMPVMSLESGTIAPMVMSMAEEQPKEWKLVYLSGNVAIFVRNTPENRAVVDCCEVPYAELFTAIQETSDYILIMLPGNPNALLSKAFALYGMGRYEEAKQILLGLPPTPLQKMLYEKVKDY